jgi:LPXTG-motif cell wall-anchored protein
MLELLITVLAQNTPNTGDDGGPALLIVGVVIAVLIAVGIFLVFTKSTKRKRGTAPGDDPHPPGQVGH